MKLLLNILIAGLISSLFGCSNPTSKFEAIVQKVKDGSFKPDSNGVITVPKEFESLLARKEIYFEQKGDGLILILFPTWFGRGDDIEGYLYCSRDLQSSDFYTIDWGEGSVQHIDVAAKNMLTVEPLKPNWYWVSRRLD